ncbi:MAG: DUF2264 domain-containing protein [Acidimicrobiales bacterium]
MTVAPPTWIAPEAGRSPITGWERHQWEDTADRLLEQAHRHLRPIERGPMAAFGRWPASADHLSGFARSFVLASYRMAQPHKQPTADLADRYGSGLVDRLRGAHRRAWPTATTGQSAVYEAAHLATALYDSRTHVWDRLDDTDRQRLVSWLSAAQRGETYDNNWALAPLVVAGFLRSVGAEWDRRVVDDSHERVEQWYQGDGCYTDGPSPRFDHYWGWGIQHFLAQWERMSPEPDPELRRRLGSFLGHYGAAFDDRGAPLHVGRSLSYRAAMVGVFWAGAMLDATPFEPGQTRCLASAVVSHFADRGTFGTRRPTQGWYRSFGPMADHYATPSAPLLCGLGFSGLLLAPTHPVWTDREQHWRSSTDEHELGSTGFRITHRGGVSHLHAERPTDSDADRPAHPLYTRLGYTSATGPEWPRAGNRETDNELTVHDGRRRHRRGPVTHPVPGGGQWSWTGSTGPGQVITASVVADDGVQIRAHRVLSPPGDRVAETGFAVAGNRRPAVAAASNWILCVSDEVQVLTAALFGFDTTAWVRQRGTNAFGPHSAMGRLLSTQHGADRVLVSLHLVTRNPIDPGRVLADITVTAAGADGVLVQRGDRRFELSLPTPTGSTQS